MYIYLGKIDVEPRDTSNINLGSGTMSLLSATQNGNFEHEIGKQQSK